MLVLVFLFWFSLGGGSILSLSLHLSIAFQAPIESVKPLLLKIIYIQSKHNFLLSFLASQLLLLNQQIFHIKKSTKCCTYLSDSSVYAIIWDYLLLTSRISLSISYSEGLLGIKPNPFLFVLEQLCSIFILEAYFSGYRILGQHIPFAI